MASEAQQAPRASAWRIAAWGSAAVLLLVPFMLQFPWTLSDYLFAGIIFAIIGGTFELVVWRSGNRSYRSGAAVALANVLLLIWINGAVGIIGREDNPANLMFVGVVAVAVVGAFVARFEASRMQVAMIVAAASQIIVALVVLVFRLGANEPPGLAGVVILILFFAGSWLLSAGLFHRASVVPRAK